MPYRRRSGSYYRRRPRRGTTTWVRNNEGSLPSGRLGVNDIWAVDLLAPLHTQDSVMKVGGQYENAPSATGTTITRIRLSLYVRWHRDDPAQFEFSDGAWMGCIVGTWPYDTATHKITAPAAPDQHPWDPVLGANTEDWLAWSYMSALDPVRVGPEISDTTGTGFDRVYYSDFDIRSKRRIADMGDTCVFAIKPNGAGTQGIDEVQVTTSTLLSRRT